MSGDKAPLRLRGTIRIGDRGAILEAEDGAIWRLQGSEDITGYAEREVRVEAYQRGLNQLELLWIGDLSA